MYSVETCSNEVEIDNVTDVTVCGTEEVPIQNSLEIDVGLQNYTICSDDIYIANKGEEFPDWLDELLEDFINDTTELSFKELNDLVGELDKGITNEAYYRENADSALGVLIDALKVEVGNNSASVVDIKYALTNDYISKSASFSWTQAWFDNSGAAQTEYIVAEASKGYATAGQYTTLHAEVKQNEDELAAQKAAIDALEHQVDGVIETHYGLHDVVVDGCLDPTKEPYATWIADGVNLAAKTGDTYVKYKVEDGKNVYIASWKFVAGSLPSCPNNDYQWSLISHDPAVEALKTALEAKEIADGKSYQYLGDTVPTTTPQGDTIQGCDYNGDTWYYDTDNSTATKLKGVYVWDCSRINNIQSDIAQGTHWIRQIDEALAIDIKTVDEATAGYFKKVSPSLPEDQLKTGNMKEVDNGDGTYSTYIWYGPILKWQSTHDGKAQGTAASASKFIDSGGVITGWSFADGTEIQSTFAVSADHFYIQNATNTNYRPFEVIDNSVKVTNLTLKGRSIVEGDMQSSNYVYTDNGSGACPRYTVTGFYLGGKAGNKYNIIGGKIYGADIVAGNMSSDNYSWNGFTDTDPVGFKLSSCGEGASTDKYNIIGGDIFGATVTGTTINGGDINGSFINGGLTALSKIVTQHKKSTYYELDAKLTTDRTLIAGSGYERGAQIKLGIYTSNYGSTQDVFRMMAPDNSQCTILFEGRRGHIYPSNPFYYFIELARLDTSHDNQYIKIQVFIGSQLLDESNWIHVDNGASSERKTIAGIEFGFSSPIHEVQSWYAKEESTLIIPSDFNYEGEIIFRLLARDGTHPAVNQSSELTWHVDNIKTKISIDESHQD